MQQTAVISQRLKQLRLARGLSMDELVARSGGIVTKQAISKYERAIMQPSPKVLIKLGKALGVKVAAIIAEPKIKIDFVAYRKHSQMTKTQQKTVENTVLEILEKRVKLQELLYEEYPCNIPLGELEIDALEDIEDAALELRKRWKLGTDPIANVTKVLEDNGVHVVSIDANKRFDGMAAIASDVASGEKSCAAVVVRSSPCGERQRLNLTHELGHLVLNISEKIDEEKAAYRFGAAFLAPRELVLKEAGRKRTLLSTDELLGFKRQFGISLQAIMMRLKDLDIVSESYCYKWFKSISSMGWRTTEPQPLLPEKSEWLQSNVLKAYHERMISQEDAESLLDQKLDKELSLNLTKLRAIMQLPLAERRRLLSERAEIVKSHYQNNDELDGLENGELPETH